MASLSPERRQQRARVAALTKHHPDSPDLVTESRAYKALAAEDYIRKLVDEAPPLSQDQRNRLALLLRGSAPHYADSASAAA